MLWFFRDYIKLGCGSLKPLVKFVGFGPRPKTPKRKSLSGTPNLQVSERYL
jgi:hypothetical protein